MNRRALLLAGTALLVGPKPERVASRVVDFDGYSEFVHVYAPAGNHIFRELFDGAPFTGGVTATYQIRSPR